MAGSTESNARMEALTTNLSAPCGKGYTRDKATGECVKKKQADAVVENVEGDGGSGETDEDRVIFKSQGDPNDPYTPIKRKN